MGLSEYDGKYVCVKDIYGETYMGRASYGGADFLECEYGGEEDGIFIEDSLIYNSQIEKIEEVKPHGTVELWTEHLILRRYRPEDAEALYEHFATDPDMYKYSGWNPYATLEAAKETVQRFIDSYDLDHTPACGHEDDCDRVFDGDCDRVFDGDSASDRDRTSADDHDRDSDRTYSWVMDVEGVVVGTIGAYDYKADYDASQIEVGYSVDKAWQGRGFATEALTEVLKYLTENEGITCVTAWCAGENIGSVRVLEKSGMKLVRTEQSGLIVGDETYDRLIFEYMAD